MKTRTIIPLFSSEVGGLFFVVRDLC